MFFKSKFILLFLLMLILASCISSPTGDLVDNKLDGLVVNNSSISTVAIILPLSGANQEMGQSVLNSMMFHYKAVGKKNIILKIYDTQSSPQIAYEVAKKAIIEDGNKIVLGPIFAQEVDEVAKVSEPLGIPIIALSNNIDILKNKKNVYLISYLPSNEMEKMIHFAINEKKSKKFAIIASDNPYGKAVAASSIAILESYGITPTQVVFYPANEVKILDYIQKLIPQNELKEYNQLHDEYDLKKKSDPKNANLLLEKIKKLPQLEFDTLIIGDFGKKLNIITSHFAFSYLDYKSLTIIGNSNWDNPLTINDPVLDGAYLPFYGVNLSFTNSYIATFGKFPSTLDYIGADSIATLLSIFYQDFEGNFVADYTKQNLTSNHYKGILGSFVFQNNGMISRDMGVKQLGYKSVSIVSPVISSSTIYKKS